MATQSALLTAIEAALTAAGYTPAPSNDTDAWPSWAAVGAGATPFVLVDVSSDETGGANGSRVGHVDIDLGLAFVAGNPFDAHAGERASMTTARALRILIEALGDGIAARFTYRGTTRRPFGSGLWLSILRFDGRQTDTYT